MQAVLSKPGVGVEAESCPGASEPGSAHEDVGAWAFFGFSFQPQRVGSRAHICERRGETAPCRVSYSEEVVLWKLGAITWKHSTVPLRLRVS